MGPAVELTVLSTLDGYHWYGRLTLRSCQLLVTVVREVGLLDGLFN